MLPSSMVVLTVLMYLLFHALCRVSLPKFAGIPSSFFTNPASMMPLVAWLALDPQHNLASPLGRVATCIQGNTQKVFVPVFVSTISINFLTLDTIKSPEPFFAPPAFSAVSIVFYFTNFLTASGYRKQGVHQI